MRWRELLQRALGGEQNLPPFRGGHSSPHTFDRFDSSRIGTGEGAQSYGHGLYFAENPVVARHYRNTFTRDEATIGGENAEAFINRRYADDPIMLENAMDMYNELLGQDYTVRSLRNHYQDVARQNPEGVIFSDYVDLLREWESLGFVNRIIPGTTYETNLYLDPQRVLQQHRRLSEHTPEVREPMLEWLRDLRIDPGLAIPNEELNAANARILIENALVGRGQSRGRVSNGLRERGIQGQIYPDGESRNTAEQTFNMVVHPGEESRIEILRRWGLLPFAGVSAYDALGGTE